MDLKKEKQNKKPKKEKKEKKQFDVKTLKNYFNQKTFMGITGVGIALAVVVYVFIYLDYTQQTEEISESNKELKAVVDELQEYADNMEMYQTAIDEMGASIKETLSEYPADAREEDVLMLAVQIQENNSISYSSISMDEPEVVYEIPYDLVSQVGVEEYDRDIKFVDKHATYVNVTDYANLKSVIEQVYDAPNRIGIDNIVYTKNDEDGTLEGSISLYFYSATGTGAEYTLPDIADYLAGTSDMFQSGSPRKQSEEIGESEEDIEQENGEEAQAGQ
jgi:Tfp pilus assembly protein PilO